MRALLLLLLVGAALLLADTARGATPPKVLVINFDADVNPVSQDFVSSQLKKAGNGHYDAAVIALNTPGGLLSSKDKIVLSELSAKVPVIVYVSPKGGFAGSAGVWIAEAADVLAMAPETNIGSSTPIDGSGQNIGSDLRKKLITHEAANLRALMASHHRNAAWADFAVGTSGKLDVKMNRTAGEALDENIIDLVATDLPTLLRNVDGRHVNSAGRTFTLHTAGAHLDEVKMSLFQRLLMVLLDPNIIGLLFLVGIMGIGFEIFHPGVVLPGTIGAIAFIAALWGLTIIPFNWAGIALILFGIILFAAEAHVPAHGAMGISGVISLAIGMLLLFRGAPAPYHVDRAAILTVAVVLGASWALVARKAMQARHSPVRIGTHTLVGAIGEARTHGLVFVRGELWQAEAVDGEPLAPGEMVRVENVDGLVLSVAHAHDLQPTA